MKDSMEQDQRITREFGRYRLAPPSPDLHDRVLRAAREALASTDAELHWADRWLRTCGAFRQEILAFASAVMLALGLVMQLGGVQSVLADSIERLKVMVTVSGCLYRATSMDCTVQKTGAGDENSRYRVRWNAAGITRIDAGSANGAEQTLWVSKETVSVADYRGGAVRSTAITAMPSKWQVPMEFRTPTILARHMEERYGLAQTGERSGAGSGEFLITGRDGRQAIEIAVDARTYLPKVLKKWAPDSGRTNGDRVCLMEVRFHWNQPIPGPLFVPGPFAAKREINPQ